VCLNGAAAAWDDENFLFGLHQQGVQLLFYTWKIVISREMISHERKNIRQESHPPGK